MKTNKGFANFWRYLFPIKEICEFLTCFNQFPLNDQEFAFGEYYQRYEKKGSQRIPLRFTTSEALQRFLVIHDSTCVQAGPHGDSIRPLFFDFDLDDMHTKTSPNRPAHIPPIIRECDCLAGTCCDVCWRQIAVKPLKDMLAFFKDIMGYKRILPIYSGNRGFWIIVWDKEVWTYDTISRTNIVNRVPAYIDRNVTIQSRHLMKIPLTPHKKTGVLTVPIVDADTFVPSHAPRYSDIEDKEILLQWATQILLDRTV